MTIAFRFIMNRFRLANIRKVLLLILLTGLSVAASAGPKRASKKVDECVKVNRSVLEVADSILRVSLQMTVVEDVPRRQSIILVPELVDTVSLRKVAFPMVLINSRNQQIYYDRYLHEIYPEAIVREKIRGTNLNLDYSHSVPYEPWMKKAVVMLRQQDCVCSRPKNASEMVVAQFPKEKEEAPVIRLLPVYLPPPADQSIKVRQEKGSAYLTFEVNKWDIKPDYMNNPAELQKIHNSVNLVRDDAAVTITKMTLEGYASPEGSYEHNMELSINRTEALKRYLEMTGMTRGIRLEAQGMGENWDGFMKFLEENPDFPQQIRILAISKMRGLSPDEKEQQMRKTAPEGFAYVLENAFPALRCTNYTVEYTVRSFTLEESEEVFRTRPINLSLNEIYRLADKYSQDEEKYYSIIRKAYMLYPNDSYINLTMAYLAIRKGDVEDAEEYLSKVNDCPEKTLNEGLVAYLKGDVETAVKLAEEARDKGLVEAVDQLEEFNKLAGN